MGIARTLKGYYKQCADGDGRRPTCGWSVGCRAAGSTRVALLQSAAWFLCLRTKGNARPQRADPGLGGATALRLADSEPRRDAPAIGTSTVDLRQSNQPPGLAVTLTAAGARGMEHRDQNQRMHARRACTRLPVDNQASRPRDRCRSADAVRERVSGRPGDPRRPHEGRSGGTRDLLGRHRAMSEGIVNNLMNHQGVRHASWKGLALARFQVGLAIILLNTLKWYKIRHSQLRPMSLQPAA